MHQQRRKKQPSQGGCVVPYICVVPASYVTACSRDGTPREPGEDSVTCRCLRPTCASNLVVTWGGGGRLRVCVCVNAGEGWWWWWCGGGGGGVDNDDDDEKRLVRLWEGKLVCRAKLNVAHNGISRTLPERNAHNGAAGSLVSRWFVQSENTITGDHETVVTLRLTRLDLVHSLKKAASKKM